MRFSTACPSPTSTVLSKAVAQFDVRRNPSRRTGRDIPYLVEVQSSALSPSRRRVVIPLVRVADLRERDRTLNPEFTIGGEGFVRVPLDIAAVPASALGDVVGSLKDESDDIVNALDLLFARY
jgi:toxin CcdB